ncbi:TNF receptor-associated factor family protein DDB_G0290965-like [Chenopodium quinoa]|uniref:TNF receptor-associated factor family protein DDB_G0290965-like n=1 Tax=Chenopodium quinoa TaxID=63459 RepID=UPI000B797256|nr:TNF receptor-associated factor family protein DDB_G0290965-like [Chenopodium quinoa]
MMDPDTAFTEVDLKQEKFEDIKEEGKKFSCELCDKEMVHKMALVLLEGLSTACVDNTTGDMFKSPGTVAAEIRKEMLDYLIERSESFVAESFLAEEGPEEKPDQPSDIISDLIDDFATLKMNILTRVSGWLLSDMREDKIDEFVQEMELNSFWLLDRRETIAQTLLKNVDFKNEFHCNLKFKSEEELKQHRPRCGFRTVLCRNEGCCATFSAAQMELHDSVCPFKVLPCEQKCPEILMRREMDRHCITVCPMKLVNCPFYSIGCQATVPSCNVKEHFLDDIRSHLLYALQYLHKGISAEDLTHRADQIEHESSGRLAGMQSVRSFTNAVKNLDSKLEPFEVVKKNVDSEEDTKKPNSKEPTSEGKNNLESVQISAEDNKESGFERSPSENMKGSDTEHTETELKKNSVSEQSSPNGNKKHELGTEELTKPDTDQSAVEDMKKSEFKLAPAGDSKELDSENLVIEDMENIRI